MQLDFVFFVQKTKSQKLREKSEFFPKKKKKKNVSHNRLHRILNEKYNEFRELF